MLQHVITDSAFAQPTYRAAQDAAVIAPVVAVAPRPPSIVGPVIAAFCCLGLILLLIASAIVLSLIPIYLNSHGSGRTGQTQTVNLLVSLPAGSSFPVGTLNANQRAILQTYLQQQLNNNANTKGSTITVLNAVGINSGRRKRQSSNTATSVQVTALITGSASTGAVNSFANNLQSTTLPSVVASNAASAADKTARAVRSITKLSRVLSAGN